MDDAPRQAKEIFLTALAKGEPTARAAYLDEACRGDAALRERVEALLRAHDESQNPLERPAAELGPTQLLLPELERPGMLIGPYKLMEKIGEGGFGLVFVAEQQQPVRRRVALKVIKPGMDTREVIARFEAERQALALMDHPHIARVLDAGATETGRPYFVMELVRGVPITEYCDQHQLTPRERLALFVTVCQAVQHAHGKAIIHRDLKPSNILIAPHDGRPVVKVIDFGIAKAIGQQLTDKTVYTRFMQMIGTPLYMSPEQAEVNALDVDIRSDVYSLGVLLYELLTGTTPFEGKRFAKAANDEIRRIIKEEEPPKPSTRLSSLGDTLSQVSSQRKTEPAKLSALVKGDLDWIVMKALEKQRERRYETVSSLARDVERHLSDEAVEARPPSVPYRLGKVIRKNRVLLSTAAAFVVLLLIAAVVSSCLAVRAMNAERFADAKREQAEKSEKQAALDRNLAQRERRRAEAAAAEAQANAAEAGRALDRLALDKGMRLADENNLYAALSSFVKPLGRPELTAREEKLHRTRIASYLRHAAGRLRLRQAFEVGGPVTVAAWNERATQVLTVSGPIVQVWDVRSGESIAVLRHDHDVVTAQFAPDGETVVAVTNSDVYTWDVARKRRIGLPLDIKSFEGPLSDPSWNGDDAVEISRDSSRIVFRGQFATRVVDRATGKLVGEWAAGKESYQDRCILSADGGRVLLLRDGVARVVDLRTETSAEVTLDHGGHVAGAAFSPDGARVLTIGGDQKLQVWDARHWRRLARMDVGSRTYGRFSPDGRQIACWGFRNFGAGDLAWYETESGRLIGEIPDVANPLQGTTHRPGFDWRPDSRQFLRVSVQREVSLWDPSLPVRPSARLTFGDPVTTAVYGPDGQTLLTATSGGEVRVWDVGQRHEPFALKPRAPDELSACLPIRYATSERSRNYVTFNIQSNDFSDNTKWLFQGRIKPLLPPDATFADGAASPDRSRVLTVTADRNEIRLWDVRTKQSLGEPLRSESPFNWANFSADSQFAAVACENGTALLINAKTAASIGPALNHGAAVLYAAFRPGAEVLVTCGENGTARLWDARTGRPIGEPLHHDRAVTLAAFSADGKTLATASLDGRVRLWDDRGRQLGTLDCKGYRGDALFFHPDGVLLVAAGGKLTLWDVASQQPLSPPMDEADISDSYAWWNTFWDLPRRTGDAMTIPAFDLPLESRTATDLGKLCQLYSGRRYDALGDGAPLGKDERQSLWHELRARYPQEFAVSKSQEAQWVVRFHAQRAASADDLQDRIRNDQAAADDVRSLAESLATSAWVRQVRTRADSFAAQQEWRQAADAYAAAARLSPADHFLAYLAAVASRTAGDEEGYRKTCREMLERAGHEPSPDVAQRILYAALPGQGLEAAELLRLAKIAALPRLHGAALCRAGQYDQSLKTFSPNGVRFFGRGWDWLFVALSQHRMGNAADAKQSLERARDWIKTADQQPETRDWWERAEEQLLLAEIEALFSKNE